MGLITTGISRSASPSRESFIGQIIKEEMAHQTQVSVLSPLHLWQAEEIKFQSNEIRYLSTLLEKQQAILEKVQEQQSRVPEMPIPQHPTLHCKEFNREALNILPSTVNARWGAGLVHTSGISQDIPVIGRVHFEDELSEEATWASHSWIMCILVQALGGLSSTPRKFLETWSRASLNPTTYPPGYETMMMV